jgi:hypothetical protein
MVLPSALAQQRLFATKPQDVDNVVADLADFSVAWFVFW